MLTFLALSGTNVIVAKNFFKSNSQYYDEDNGKREEFI